MHKLKQLLEKLNERTSTNWLMHKLVLAYVRSLFHFSFLFFSPINACGEVYPIGVELD